MLIYRAQASVVDPRPRLAALARAVDGLGRATVEAARELVVDFGELEAAVIDARAPSRDDCDEVTAAWRRGALASGRLFCRALDGGDRGACAVELARAIATLGAWPLPARVELRPPEGYAHYGLYPEQYVAAARAFVAETRPARAVCVGLRSIGTSLSAVVAGALAEAGVAVETHTLRPRGAPFDRVVALGTRLTAALRPRAGDDAWWLVVDEGPGLSGSSFGATAAALEALGAPADRIVLVPSWDADASAFVSDEARRRWQRHRRVVGAFDPRALVGAPVEDWSAGGWRDAIGAREVAVQPQHERRKYRDRAAGVVHRFAGLGRHGRARLARARALADAGWSPPVRGLRHGLLALDFVAGTRARPGTRDPSLFAAAARYLAFVRRRFPASAAPAPLGEMVTVNVRALLGEGWPRALAPLLRTLDAPADAVELDARLLPHEWLRTADGWRKLDGVDHGDDHFFPGAHDPAWDLAAVAVEHALPPALVRALVDDYERLSGDHHVARRLPAFAVAWRAFRGAYAAVAARQLGGSPDGRRFAALAARHAAGLRRSLARAAVRLP